MAQTFPPLVLSLTGGVKFISTLQNWKGT